MEEGGEKHPDPPDRGKSETERIRYEYQENIKYNGYKVIVWKKGISPTIVGEIILEDFSKDQVRVIAKNGANSVIIHCNSASVANTIAKNQKLIREDYKAYIPIYYVTSCALIWDIDVKYSVSDVMKRMETGQFEIHSIERIRRQARDGNQELIDTRRVKVYFHGTDIPEYVFMNLVRLECKPFIHNIVTCKKCWRIGHSSRRCQEEHLRCRRCLENHLESSCEAETYKCASCTGNHSSTYAMCRERKRQHDIATAMATRNLSRNEANDLFPKLRKNPFAFNQIVTHNKYSVLENEDFDTNFPPLNASHKKTNETLKIPAHGKPELPIIERRGRSTTRRPGPDTSNHGRKRDKSQLTDDELLDEEIQRVKRERRIMQQKQMSQNPTTKTINTQTIPSSSTSSNTPNQALTQKSKTSTQNPTISITQTNKQKNENKLDFTNNYAEETRQTIIQSLNYVDNNIDPRYISKHMETDQ